jgi:hypothetical protein
VKKQTFQRVSTPTAILVGLSESIGEHCSEVLAKAGLRVLRAAHAAGAAERIPIVMARIDVLPEGMTEADLELLGDRCVAVGADVLTVALEPTPQELEEIATGLREAASNALMKALRDG